MSRLLLYAHHDATNRVRSASRDVVRSLAPFVDKTTIISTARLAAEHVAELAREHGTVELRENLGFDFSMWQRPLLAALGEDWDEVWLVNSSVVGPFRPLAPIFAKMSAVDCGFWSLTEGLAPTRHLHSYFVSLRRPVLRSSALRQFFESVLPFRNKWGTIAAYEIGLTLWLEQQGFVGVAAWPLPALAADVLPVMPSLLHVRNPLRALAVELLDRGFPFVKLDALAGRTAEIASMKERAEHAVHHRRLVRRLRRENVDVSTLLDGF